MERSNLQLTKRESECISLVALGFTVKEVGVEYDISYRTVEKHIENIKRKFGCEKTVELVYKLVKKGLID